MDEADIKGYLLLATAGHLWQLNIGMAMVLAGVGRPVSELAISLCPTLLPSPPFHGCGPQRKLQKMPCTLTSSQSHLPKESILRQCLKYIKWCHSKAKNLNITISLEAPCTSFLFQIISTHLRGNHSELVFTFAMLLLSFVDLIHIFVFVNRMFYLV